MLDYLTMPNKTLIPVLLITVSVGAGLFAGAFFFFQSLFTPGYENVIACSDGSEIGFYQTEGYRLPLTISGVEGSRVIEYQGEVLTSTKISNSKSSLGTTVPFDSRFWPSRKTVLEPLRNSAIYLSTEIFSEEDYQNLASCIEANKDLFQTYAVDNNYAPIFPIGYLFYGKGFADLFECPNGRDVNIDENGRWELHERGNTEVFFEVGGEILDEDTNLETPPESFVITDPDGQSTRQLTSLLSECQSPKGSFTQLYTFKEAL